MYIPVVVEALDALVAVSAMLGGGVHVLFTQVAVDGVLRCCIHIYIHTHKKYLKLIFLLGIFQFEMEV